MEQLQGSMGKRIDIKPGKAEEAGLPTSKTQEEETCFESLQLTQ
ncbi:MAG: hypothetical protein ABGY43_16210 [bacterium]|jgi:hypothetical protein